MILPRRVLGAHLWLVGPTIALLAEQPVQSMHIPTNGSSIGTSKTVLAWWLTAIILHYFGRLWQWERSLCRKLR